MRSISTTQFAYFVVATVVVALCTIGMTTLALGWFEQMLQLLLLCFVPYALLLFVAPRWGAERSCGIALVSACIAAAPWLFIEPIFSDDVYRYLWEGRILNQGWNPYAYAPDDPQLHYLRDSLWQSINHKELNSIYPLGAQALFSLYDICGASILGAKLIAFSFHLVTIAVLSYSVPQISARGMLLFALNPLLLLESALNAHFDAAVGLFVLLAAIALCQRQTLKFAIWSCTAVLFKLIGIVLVFAAIKKHRAVALSICLVFVAMLGVYAVSGWPDTERMGAASFARHWEGNAGFYIVVKDALRLGFEQLADSTGMISVDALGMGAGSNLRLHVNELASLVARFLGGVALICVGVLSARRISSPFLLARWLVLVVLLFSPQVHPWYLAWLFPLEMAAGRQVGTIWSVLLLASYAVIPAQNSTHVWQEVPVYAVLSYALIGIALLSEWYDVRVGTFPA